MSLITGWATNRGIVREENQDNCYVSVNENSFGITGIAVMCDGMGGLKNGGMASSITCKIAAEWYDSEYRSKQIIKKTSDKEVFAKLSEVILEANSKLVKYGRANRIKIGTTASIALFVNYEYYIVHVGDSRIYEYSDKLIQLTDDDTVAAVKLRRGEITDEQYKCSRQRNILTQCVGVVDDIDIHKYKGTYKSGDVFFLCSDGMYHCISDEEISGMMLSQRKEKGDNITAFIEKSIDKMISRGETDNLTGVIVYAL